MLYDYNLRYSEAKESSYRQLKLCQLNLTDDLNNII